MMLCQAIALNNHAARSSHRESVEFLRLALTILRNDCPHEAVVGKPNEKEALFDAISGSMNSGISLEASVGSAIPIEIHDQVGYSTPGDSDGVSGPTALKATLSTSKVPRTGRTGHGSRSDTFLELFDDLLMVSLDGEVSTHLVAAVILFNLAVLRQAAGLRMNRSPMLMQARNVYLMALAILETFSDEGGDIPALLLLPIFNNLAAMEAHFYEYEAMSYYLDCGLALVTDTDPGLGATELSCFFRNIMLPIPSVAAAA